MRDAVVPEEGGINGVQCATRRGCVTVLPCYCPVRTDWGRRRERERERERETHTHTHARREKEEPTGRRRNKQQQLPLPRGYTKTQRCVECAGWRCPRNHRIFALSRPLFPSLAKPLTRAGALEKVSQGRQTVALLALPKHSSTGMPLRFKNSAGLLASAAGTAAAEHTIASSAPSSLRFFIRLQCPTSSSGNAWTYGQTSMQISPQSNPARFCTCAWKEESSEENWAGVAAVYKQAVLDTTLSTIPYATL